LSARLTVLKIFIIHFCIQYSSIFKLELIMAPSSTIPSSDPVLPPISGKKVPKPENEIKKGSELFDLVVKHGLGEEAFTDTFDGATGLWHKVRTVIGKVAVGLDGKATTRWAKIPVQKKMAIITTLNKAAPWLQAFQDGWAAEWLLNRAINQRVSDGSRKVKKRRHEEMMAQFAQSPAANVPHSSSDSSPPSLVPSPPQISPPPAPLSSSPPPPPTPAPLPSNLTEQIQLLQAQMQAQMQAQINLLIQQHMQQRQPLPEEATATTATTATSDEEVTTLPEMPVEVVSRPGGPGRKTRRKGTSKVYQEAIQMERESEDEREAQRSRKALKRQRKQTTGKELDGFLTELGMTERPGK
jgi:hypothetical protein